MVNRNKQLPLSRLETPPIRADGLFFAIFPDVATSERLEQLAHRLRLTHGLNGRPFRKERFHVTLRYLGLFAEGLPEGTIEWANRVAADVAMPSFKVEFNHVEHFGPRPGRRPFVLKGDEGLPGLFMLEQALQLALEQRGLAGRPKSPFNPHVTMLYDHREDSSNREIREIVDPISWTVREFVLVRSLHGRSRYESLARWPLLS